MNSNGCEEAFIQYIDDLYEVMECSEKDETFVFSFLNEEVLDIYFYNKKLFTDGYRKFSIVQGTPFEKNIEMGFVWICRNFKLRASEELYKVLKQKTVKRFNGLKVNPNENSIGKTLLNIYFASHKCGLIERLYKAGLWNIADRIDEISKYYKKKDNLERLLEKMPRGLLRILNQNELVSFLFDKELGMKCIEIYEKYSDKLGGKIPNYYQWLYLENISKLWKENPVEEFDKRIFKYLGNVSDCDEYAEVLDFIGERRTARRNGYLVYEKMPNKRNDILDATERLKEINSVKPIEAEYESELRKYLAPEKYEYEGSNYSVHAARSIKEIIDEAINQNNCLANPYVLDRIIKEHRVILLINKKNKKSYMTVEVTDGEITQVYLKNNGVPRFKDFKFIEEYANDKNLSFQPYMLETSYPMFGPEGFEFYDYLSEYSARERKEGIEYVNG